MLAKILVCLDGSEAAERVLSYVGKEAVLVNSKIILLRVVHIPQSNVPLNIPGSPAIPVVTKAELARNISEEKLANDYLEDKAQSLLQQKIDVENVVLTGHPGEIIVTYAQDNGCSLIAMATHGHGGFRRLALGSTADYVVHHATVPVLTVR